MLPDIIPSWPPAKWDYTAGSRSTWEYLREGVQRRNAEREPSPNQPLAEERLGGHPCGGAKSAVSDFTQSENAAPKQGHSLFQEVFFFCTVQNFGDVPGAGCIYVETVVDRDAGYAFAKVYSAKNAMNAVDILASRVVPFFDRQGSAIQEIHTRKTSEYCGLVPAHPFETFLATSHILHMPIDEPGQPCNYLCEQFFRFLEKEYFQPALRRTFQLSLDDLQRDLDTFIEAFNASPKKQEMATKTGHAPSKNFPVDL